VIDERVRHAQTRKLRGSSESTAIAAESHACGKKGAARTRSVRGEASTTVVSATGAMSGGPVQEAKSPAAAREHGTRG
jgi:hypothetical protein